VVVEWIFKASLPTLGWQRDHQEPDVEAKQLSCAAAKALIAEKAG
jgi:hypothetical protein